MAATARILVLKLGDTLPALKARKGDFEDWIVAGLGVAREDVRVVDVPRGDPLPDASDHDGIIITGSEAMVTERREWSERTADWLRKAVGRGPAVLGICYGHQLLAHALGGVVGNNPRGRSSAPSKYHSMRRPAQMRSSAGCPRRSGSTRATRNRCWSCRAGRSGSPPTHGTPTNASATAPRPGAFSSTRSSMARQPGRISSTTVPTWRPRGRTRTISCGGPPGPRCAASFWESLRRWPFPVPEGSLSPAAASTCGEARPVGGYLRSHRGQVHDCRVVDHLHVAVQHAHAALEGEVAVMSSSGVSRCPWPRSRLPWYSGKLTTELQALRLAATNLTFPFTPRFMTMTAGA